MVSELNTAAGTFDILLFCKHGNGSNAATPIVTVSTVLEHKPKVGASKIKFSPIVNVDFAAVSLPREFKYRRSGCIAVCGQSVVVIYFSLPYTHWVTFGILSAWVSMPLTYWSNHCSAILVSGGKLLSPSVVPMAACKWFQGPIIIFAVV